LADHFGWSGRWWDVAETRSWCAFAEGQGGDRARPKRVFPGPRIFRKKSGRDFTPEINKGQRRHGPPRFAIDLPKIPDYALLQRHVLSMAEINTGSPRPRF